MTAFHFSMQRVLDMKEKEKDRALQEYGESLHRWEEFQRGLEILEDKEAALKEEMKKKENARISTYHTYQNYFGHLKWQKETLRKRLALIQDELEIKQSALKEKTVDEKLWTNVKHQHRQRFEERVRREEQTRMDEVAATQYIRQTERSQTD